MKIGKPTSLMGYPNWQGSPFFLIPKSLHMTSRDSYENGMLPIRTQEYKMKIPGGIFIGNALDIFILYACA